MQCVCIASSQSGLDVNGSESKKLEACMEKNNLQRVKQIIQCVQLKI